MINIFLEFIFSHKNVLKNISMHIINLVLFLHWAFTAKSFFVFGSATRLHFWRFLFKALIKNQAHTCCIVHSNDF